MRSRQAIQSAVRALCRMSYLVLRASRWAGPIAALTRHRRTRSRMELISFSSHLVRGWGLGLGLGVGVRVRVRVRVRHLQVAHLAVLVEGWRIELLDLVRVRVRG